MHRRRKYRNQFSGKGEAAGRIGFCGLVLALVSLSGATATQGQFIAHDPGVRHDSIGAGSPLGTLSPAQAAAFADSMSRFVAGHSVSGTIPGESDGGLGPRFNSNSCGSCHAQPDVGGSSPSASLYPYIGPNPQVAVATLDGATNTLPYFVHPDGPVREARFVFVVGPNGSLTSTPDGGVHDLFTITGRSDATNAPGPGGLLKTCVLPQPNFDQMRALNNIIFRIPTPVFGAGFIENISDATILANLYSNAAAKQALGISGQPNRSGNDGTITRFGWKAQNKSLEIFAGEAYNVEQGVSNELFPNERPSPGETLPFSCIFNSTPEDAPNFGVSAIQTPSDVTAFANFMRFLDQPAPSTTSPGGATSIANGNYLFTTVVQCALCHTPELKTAASSLTSALNYKDANLFSDLLVHHMGSGLADGVSQGAAGPDQFRTAPLWGVGQRIFFLHDGRTSDLLKAIQQHASPGSEANGVIQRFNQLTESQKQDLLNFLRSL
jgi:CxxC motif-containing protein (DUF1111 family)